MTTKRKYSGKLQRLYTRLKRYRLPARVLFILMGIASTVWFLARVIPKPQRAGYPCMQAAAPVMSGFVLWLLAISGAGIAAKKAGRLVIRARYLAAAGLFAGALVLGGIALHRQSEKAIAGTYTTDADYTPNEPMGTPIGVAPGRVVWAWDPDATNENCSLSQNEDGHFDPDHDDAWFMNKNNDMDAIDAMVSWCVCELTDTENDADAWDAMFTSFNQRRGNGDEGYTDGEDIFIKINRTSAWGEPGSWGKYNADLSRNDNGWHPQISETSPHVVLALLRQLVNEAGVPQGDIYVGDPMKQVYKEDYDIWHAEFPDVNYLGNDVLPNYSGIDLFELDRKPVKKMNEPFIFYADEMSVLNHGSDPFYTIFDKAEYLINVPTMKAHARGGITIGAKNHFGSHTRNDAADLHPGLVAAENDDATRTDYGMYRVLTDIMGHDKVGRNTLLVLVDALWTSDEAVTHPEKLSMYPFENDYASSVLASMDQVAIESVCFDILRTEYNGSSMEDKRPNMGAVDDHLHQAASSDNWPAGVFYDPEGDGSDMPSLGVHEHWNNATDMRYSGNGNPGSGLQLIRNFDGEILGLEDRLSFNLSAARIYPNPTRDRISVEMDLPRESGIRIAITDLGGRTVRVLEEQDQPAGPYTGSFDLSGLESGIYVYRVTCEGLPGGTVHSGKLQVIH